MSEPAATAKPRARPVAPGEPILFVTGKLAAHSLEAMVARLAAEIGFVPHLYVAKISVAALMTADWLVGKLACPPDVRRVILPGWCGSGLDRLAATFPEVTIELGPKDLYDLPEFLHASHVPDDDYGAFDIEILAEINHANRWSIDAVIAQAEEWKSAGADVVDLGGTPGEPWEHLGPMVRSLTDRGFRVAIDSFDPREIATATAAGAELVLSVTPTTCQAAKDWGREVVLIPDQPHDDGWLAALSGAIETLDRDHVPFRLDPVLEPIGFGFAASLGRYLEVRQRFPTVPMLMGVGNLTELTEVDSAGVNALLAGFCQELAIGSVLTTEVIHWAQSAVRELSVARQLMRHAVSKRSLPKHVDSRLVMLRDGRPAEHADRDLRAIQQQLRDLNFRLFAERGRLIAFNASCYEEDDDAFRLFERLGVSDPSHAFYLGWELMKATLALQLGKRYVQDEALGWGLLTQAERRRRHQGS